MQWAYLIGALIVIWLIGYGLVLNVAPAVFRPREVEAAVALLLGLCIVGVVLILPMATIDNPVVTQALITSALPALGVALWLLFLLRCGKQALYDRTRVLVGWLHPKHIGYFSKAWGSVLLLVCGAVVIITTRPLPAATIELYASRSGNSLHVTVASSSTQPENFVLVTRDTSGHLSAPITLPAVSATSAPASAMVALLKTARIELYRVQDDPTRQRPLQWLAFAAQEPGNE